jgi:catechol 2,3-dioxygenase-like lactoylglutathione lyase family enzyme
VFAEGDDSQQWKESDMQAMDKLIMLSLAVSDMAKAKEFYADKLGLTVVSDYGEDGRDRWVSLALPEGGISITLTTFHENMKPGTAKLYFGTSDIEAARGQLAGRGVEVDEIKDDLFGPGSGVKWFNLDDPDGSQVFLVQA